MIMVHLIDKDALVAEIEKRIKETESMQPKFDQFWAGQISAFNGVLEILNILEVKEVDLEKEFDYYIKDNLTYNFQFKPFTHLYNCANYFYELGLKTQKGE